MVKDDHSLLVVIQDSAGLMFQLLHGGSMKAPIEEFIILGDSLTDRGAMLLRKNLVKFSGLEEKKSPVGRFTNGYAWSDYFLTMVVNALIAKDITNLKHNMSAFNKSFKQPVTETLFKLGKIKHIINSADKCDAVLNGEINQKSLSSLSRSERNEIVASNIIAGDTRYRNTFTLQTASKVYYQGHRLARIFAIGGLTSHSYAWQFCLKIKQFILRMILNHLAEMRGKLELDDEAKEITLKHKAKSLVIEWSGSNDLITVNSRPTMAAVDLAITARVKNVTSLIQQGYSRFVLFNIPDLSLTPRYVGLGKKEQENAHQCSLAFKQKLQKAREDILQRYPYCQIDIFDIYSIFRELYFNPEKYGFDSKKLNIPYTSTKEFKQNAKKNTPVPSEAYLFWDTVHPSADTHAILGSKFYEWIREKYYFVKSQIEPGQPQQWDVSAAALLKAFRKAYKEALDKDRVGFFGRLRRSNLDYRHTSLSQIIFHALYEKGARTFRVLKELNWLNKKGNLNLNITALTEAYEEATLTNIKKLG